MIVKPFQGIRPRRDLAAEVASLPYDVVSRDEARELARDNPHSFLHVVRAEIDLDPEVEPYDDRVYERSRRNFRGMIDRGWLAQDERPSYYVYRLRMAGHVQTGVVGAAAIDDYLEGRVKKHEQTRPAKEDDRLRVNLALGAHPGPILLTHPPDDGLRRTLAAIVEGGPEVHFAAPDGVEHTLWVVDSAERTATIERHFAAMPATFVADGHHRSAAAARACETVRREIDSPTGDESCNYFLAVHFPSDEMRILDYNRIVRDLGGLSTAEFVERVRAAGFDVSAEHTERRAPCRAAFGMYVAGGWYLLRARPEIVPQDDPVGGLDVAVLSDRLLDPVLDIRDIRTDARIDFVGGIRGMDELERRVDAGDAAVAFALYPTSIDDLMQVAAADCVMPPKSTWFEPKLRSGLIIQPLSPAPL